MLGRRWDGFAGEWKKEENRVRREIRGPPCGWVRFEGDIWGCGFLLWVVIKFGVGYSSEGREERRRRYRLWQRGSGAGILFMLGLLSGRSVCGGRWLGLK